jgi:hypothetical protein
VAWQAAAQTTDAEGSDPEESWGPWKPKGLRSSSPPPSQPSPLPAPLPDWFAQVPEQDRELLLQYLREIEDDEASKEYSAIREEVCEAWHISHAFFRELCVLASGGDPKAKDVPRRVSFAAPSEQVEAAIKGTSEQEEAAIKGKSTTHAARYMRFLRGGRNPKRCGSKICKDKFDGTEVDRLELFATWTENKEDWGKCELAELRFREESHETAECYQWCNTFDLLTLYRGDEAVVKMVKDAVKKKGSKYFKNSKLVADEKLDEYYVRVSAKTNHITKRGQRQEIGLRTDVTKDEAKDLMGDDGFFAEMSDMDESDVEVEKKKPKDVDRKKGKDHVKASDDELEEKETRKAVEDITSEGMSQVLPEANEFANHLCTLMGKGSAMVTKLKVLGMGSDVSTKIATSAKALETHYTAIKNLTSEEKTDRTLYKRDMDWARHYYKLLRKNIKVGTAMVNASEPSRKKKEDGEPRSAKKQKKA